MQRQFSRDKIQMQESPGYSSATEVNSSANGGSEWALRRKKAALCGPGRIGVSGHVGGKLGPGDAFPLREAEQRRK